MFKSCDLPGPLPASLSGVQPTLIRTCDFRARWSQGKGQPAMDQRGPALLNSSGTGGTEDTHQILVLQGSYGSSTHKSHNEGEAVNGLTHSWWGLVGDTLIRRA